MEAEVTDFRHFSFLMDFSIIFSFTFSCIPHILVYFISFSSCSNTASCLFRHLFEIISFAFHYLATSCLETCQTSFCCWSLPVNPTVVRENTQTLNSFTLTETCSVPAVWSVLVNVLYALEKNVYSAAVELTVLSVQTRSGWLTVGDTCASQGSPRAHRTSLSLRDHSPLLPDVQGLETYCFLYVVHFFSRFMQEGKFSPCYSILARMRSPLSAVLV